MPLPPDSTPGTLPANSSARCVRWSDLPKRGPTFRSSPMPTGNGRRRSRASCTTSARGMTQARRRTTITAKSPNWMATEKPNISSPSFVGKNRTNRVRITHFTRTRAANGPARLGGRRTTSALGMIPKEPKGLTRTTFPMSLPKRYGIARQPGPRKLLASLARRFRLASGPGHRSARQADAVPESSACAASARDVRRSAVHRESIGCPCAAQPGISTVNRRSSPGFNVVRIFAQGAVPPCRGWNATRSSIGEPCTVSVARTSRVALGKLT